MKDSVAPVLPGTLLALLVLSLGVRPDRRTTGWALRYLLTAVFVIGLAAFRFLGERPALRAVIHCGAHAPVAQLDRAPGFEPVGRGFKSLRARHLVDT